MKERSSKKSPDAGAYCGRCNSSTGGKLICPRCREFFRLLRFRSDEKTTAAAASG